MTTRSGKPYHQTYCYAFQLADGEMRELTEHLDTELVNTLYPSTFPGEPPREEMSAEKLLPAAVATLF